MRPVLAIAVNLLRELLRKRTSILFVLLVAGCALALPRVADDGDASRSRLQLAANYGIGLPAFLIAVATLVVDCGSISREIESQRFQPVLTKACARWQTLLGKLLGILVLDVLLVLLVMLIFALTMGLWFSASGAMLASADAGVAEVWVRIGYTGVPLVPAAVFHLLTVIVNTYHKR